MPRKKIFSASDLGIFAFKNGGKLQQKVKLNIAISEPADEEHLPTFSLGLEFLTPEKQAKTKKEKQKTSKAAVFAFRKSK